MISVSLISTTTTEDDYGDSTETTSSATYDRVRFSPRASSERRDNRAPAVITGATLYRRGDFPIKAADTILIAEGNPMVDGKWQVEGDPGFWGRGVEVAIKRVS